MMKKTAVIGAGSWGTALAFLLARKGHEVRLTTASEKHLTDMIETGENARYFPGVKFPDTLTVHMTAAEALEGVEIVLFAAPAQKFRNALENAAASITDEMIVVNAAKGIEQGTLLRLSEIFEEIMPGNRYVALSGPSHAEEVIGSLPTTVVAASKDAEAADIVQDTFMTDRFRVYTNDDVCGVELGGALKNIIALGAGISDGIGYGDNAKAALMTRGLAEMKRLGVALGASTETFLGLTGVGDLIVTCTSMHSRNRRCGILIGQGKKPEEAVKEIGMVVEGANTAVAAYDLAEKNGVDMPITSCIYHCLEGKLTAREAVDLLMNRSRKPENR